MTVVLWASAFVGIRAAGEQLSPGPLSLVRLLIGAAALSILLAVRRDALPSRADAPGLLVCGLLWFGVYNVALNEAERRVDAGTAAMLVNVGPIFIALLAGIALREGFPRSLFTGSGVAFAVVYSTLAVPIAWLALATLSCASRIAFMSLPASAVFSSSTALSTSAFASAGTLSALSARNFSVW